MDVSVPNMMGANRKWWHCAATSCQWQREDTTVNCTVGTHWQIEEELPFGWAVGADWARHLAAPA